MLLNYNLYMALLKKLINPMNILHFELFSDLTLHLIIKTSFQNQKRQLKY